MNRVRAFLTPEGHPVTEIEGAGIVNVFSGDGVIELIADLRTAWTDDFMDAVLVWKLREIAREVMT